MIAEIQDAINVIMEDSHNYIAAAIQQCLPNETNTFKKTNYNFKLYYGIEEEVKKIIWEHINETIPAIVLGTFFKNQDANIRNLHC